MQTGLDQVLALGLCDERLELGGGEGVDKTSFRDHQQKDLGACESAQLVRLSVYKFRTRLISSSLHVPLVVLVLACAC